jgi:hypothetical protein
MYRARSIIRVIHEPEGGPRCSRTIDSLRHSWLFFTGSAALSVPACSVQMLEELVGAVVSVTSCIKVSYLFDESARSLCASQRLTRPRSKHRMGRRGTDWLRKKPDRWWHFILRASDPLQPGSRLCLKTHMKRSCPCPDQPRDVIGVINVHHETPRQHSHEVVLLTYAAEQMGGAIPEPSS